MARQSRVRAGGTGVCVDRLAECAAARVRRVLLQHQLWIDLEMVAAIGAEIFPHVRDL